MTDGPDEPSGWPEWASFVQRHGYLSWLDIEVEHLADGRAVLAIERNEDFENPIGADGHDPVHGGIVATLVDTSSAFALRTTFENPSEGLSDDSRSQRLLSSAGDRRPASRSRSAPGWRLDRRYRRHSHRSRRRGRCRSDNLPAVSGLAVPSLM